MRIVLHIFKDLFEMKRTVLISIFSLTFFYTSKSSHGFYHYIFLLKITNNYSNIGVDSMVTNIFPLKPKN